MTERIVALPEQIFWNRMGAFFDRDHFDSDERRVIDEALDRALGALLEARIAPLADKWEREAATIRNRPPYDDAGDNISACARAAMLAVVASEVRALLGGGER